MNVASAIYSQLRCFIHPHLVLVPNHCWYRKAREHGLQNSIDFDGNTNMRTIAEMMNLCAIPITARSAGGEEGKTPDMSLRSAQWVGVFLR